VASSESFASGLVLAGGFRVVQTYEALHGALSKDQRKLAEP
jgi:hypothetical protein